MTCDHAVVSTGLEWLTPGVAGSAGRHSSSGRPKERVNNIEVDEL